jgi:hypothetical protein
VLTSPPAPPPPPAEVIVENIEGFPLFAAPPVPAPGAPPAPTVIGYVVAVTGNPVAVLNPPAPPPPPYLPLTSPVPPAAPPATTRYSTVPGLKFKLETTKDPGDVKT